MKGNEDALTRNPVVHFNGLWCELYQCVYECERQTWSTVCPCNSTPQAPRCWNVLTTVNWCPFPHLTLCLWESGDTVRLRGGIFFSVCIKPNRNWMNWTSTPHDLTLFDMGSRWPVWWVAARCRHTQTNIYFWLSACACHCCLLTFFHTLLCFSQLLMFLSTLLHQRCEVCLFALLRFLVQSVDVAPAETFCGVEAFVKIKAHNSYWHMLECSLCWLSSMRHSETLCHKSPFHRSTFLLSLSLHLTFLIPYSFIDIWLPFLRSSPPTLGSLLPLPSLIKVCHD